MSNEQILAQLARLLGVTEAEVASAVGAPQPVEWAESESGGRRRWMRTSGDQRWHIAEADPGLVELSITPAGAWIHTYAPSADAVPPCGSPLDGHVCVGTEQAEAPADDDAAWAAIGVSA